MLKAILPALIIIACAANIATAQPGRCLAGAMSAAIYWEGRTTASGQVFRPDGLTAAHRTLPFGTHIRITNPRTGASTIITINDRGPFTRGLDIDLARGAARAIGLASTGTICTQILGRGVMASW